MTILSIEKTAIIYMKSIIYTFSYKHYFIFFWKKSYNYFFRCFIFTTKLYLCKIL